MTFSALGDTARSLYFRIWGIVLFKRLLEEKVNSCVDCINSTCEYDHMTWLDLRYLVDDEWIFRAYYDLENVVFRAINTILGATNPPVVSAQMIWLWMLQDRTAFTSLYLRENKARLLFWIKREYV